ncbi:MAG: hypothetical protein ACTSPD_17735 [Promethearchaeota archaeon]
MILGLLSLRRKTTVFKGYIFKIGFNTLVILSLFVSWVPLLIKYWFNFFLFLFVLSGFLILIFIAYIGNRIFPKIYLINTNGKELLRYIDEIFKKKHIHYEMTRGYFKIPAQKVKGYVSISSHLTFINLFLGKRKKINKMFYEELKKIYRNKRTDRSLSQSRVFFIAGGFLLIISIFFLLIAIN